MDTAKRVEDEGQDRKLQQLVSYRLSRVQAKLNAQATKILRANGGLTLVQWRVLVLLRTFGETTVGHLARESQFDKALISRTAQSLVQQGFVRMRADEKDHRQHLLKMTAEGARIFDEAAPHMHARQEALVSSMSEKQLQVLFEALDRLEDVADQAPSP